MPTGHKKSKGRKSTRSARRGPGERVFGDIVNDVDQQVGREKKFEDLRPGDFQEYCKYLRHPSGEILVLAEEGLTIEDAERILAAGADLYYNPDEIDFNIEGRGYPDVVQEWLSGSRAAELLSRPPKVGKNMPPILISLYKSKNGRLTLHVTGVFEAN